MKKILFVSYGGGHVNVLLPLYKEYLQRKNFKCSYLALTTAASILTKHKLPFIGFKDIVDSKNTAILKLGRKLATPDKENVVVPYDESVAYLGASYSDLIADYGENEAREKYKLYGRQAFYPLRTLKHFLSQERPDLVISTNSPRAERASVDAAGELGIPSVCVVDLFAMQEISWIGKPGFANKVCVMSRYVKDKMLSSGRTSDEVIVTGNPAFDELSAFDTNLSKALAFRAKKGWKENERVILWASSVEPYKHPFSNQKGDVELPEKVEHKLVSLVEKNPDVRVIIRPHPNDNRKPDLLSDRIEVSTQDDNLNDLLGAIDCVVVLSSTVGMQAALLNKPLVNIKLSIFSCDAPYDEMGVSLGVSDLECLNSTIITALKYGTCSQKLPVAGKAKERVEHVIDGLIKSDAALKYSNKNY